MSAMIPNEIVKITREPQAYRGFWQPVMYRPDLRSPQSFVVGVISHWRGELRAVRLLNEFEKFACIYGDRLTPQLVSMAFARVSSVLAASAKEAGPVPDLAKVSPQWSLGAPLTCSGETPEQVVDRLFETVVTLIPEPSKAPKLAFEAREIGSIRADLHRILKVRLGTRFETVVHEPGYLERQVSNSEKARRYRVDIKTPKCIAAFCSAWYASAVTVEHNVLMPYVDVQALSEIDHIESRALFVARPLNSTLIDLRQADKIDEFINEMGEKLQGSGWTFEVDEDLERLSDAIVEFTH